MPISNERRSPFARKAPRRGPAVAQHVPKTPKAYLEEETLKTANLRVERKSYVIALKQNVLGRFLRIAENVGGRGDSIIVPETAFADFLRAFDSMLAASNPPDHLTNG